MVSFQLRQWFAEELGKIATTKDDDESSRLGSVIDNEGGRQLKTPRSVVRALESIRFFWPPLREVGADLADLVWLLLVKDGNPTLYRWIENYCHTSAVLSLGIARVENAERRKMLKDLLASVDENHFDDEVYSYYFADQLPGLEVGHGEKADRFKFYQDIAQHVREKSIEKKRLASPDHYRLYFALAAPSHALPQSEFDSFWNASAKGGEDLTLLLLQSHKQNTTGSLTKTDILLERLRENNVARVDGVKSRNLLRAFSVMMDDAFGLHPFEMGIGDSSSIWNRAKKLVPKLLSKLNLAQRTRVIDEVFRDGRAIGWLSYIFRSETFGQGKFGSQKKPESEWLFTSEEYDRITKFMLKRYQSMNVDQILSVPDPVSLLYAWNQGGDENGPKELIGSYVKNDDGLVRILESLTSFVNSSDRGRITVLNRRNIEPFLDFDETTNRLKGIASNAEVPALASRAKTLEMYLHSASDN